MTPPPDPDGPPDQPGPDRHAKTAPHPQGPEHSFTSPLTLDEDRIDLSDLRWTDAPVLLLFWVLAGVVFLQFFTRYVLNDSIAWTEEIARFLLIGVTFIGAIMATRKQSHIAVEFIYRWIPRTGRRIAQTAIDIISTLFFAVLTGLSMQIAGRTNQMMVSLDIPKSTIYWIVAASFACMALYSGWTAWRHLRTGTSRLIDPERHADAMHVID